MRENPQPKRKNTFAYPQYPCSCTLAPERLPARPPGCAGVGKGLSLWTTTWGKGLQAPLSVRVCVRRGFQNPPIPHKQNIV